MSPGHISALRIHILCLSISYSIHKNRALSYFSRIICNSKHSHNQELYQSYDMWVGSVHVIAHREESVIEWFMLTGFLNNNKYRIMLVWLCDKYAVTLSGICYSIWIACDLPDDIILFIFENPLMMPELLLIPCWFLYATFSHTKSQFLGRKFSKDIIAFLVTSNPHVYTIQGYVWLPSRHNTEITYKCYYNIFSVLFLQVVRFRIFIHFFYIYW